MPGHEECHDLVADLLVGHPGPVVGILSVQEDREQVATVLGAPPASADHAVDDLVEAQDRPARPQVPRCRHPAGNELAQAPEAGAEVLHQDVRRVGDGVGHVGDVGVKESLGDDGLRQRHHLRVHLDDEPGAFAALAGAIAADSSRRSRSLLL